MHKGGLSVWSEGEGCGCTFTLDIPLWSQADAVAEDVDMSEANFSWRPISKSPSTTFKDISTDSQRIRRLSPRRSTRHSNRIHPTDVNSQQIIVEVEVEHKATEEKLRVLVVDDAATNRKMLCRLLQHKYVTLEAEDGQEAVDMVLASLDTDHSIQVVLMDNHMPRMDGPTASKLLRERGYTGVIIGVTGNTLPEDIEHFMSHGADKVLPKPVDTDVLDQTIAGTY